MRLLTVYAVLATSTSLSFSPLAHAADPAPPAQGNEPMMRPEPERKQLPPQTSPAPVETIDYVTPRYEPAGFPLIGGNSDIGFQFGAVGTLTRFDQGVRPYRWNMDLVLAASIKSGPDGAYVTQQNYLWQWDVPGLFGGKLRLNPTVAYTRTINAGYYGIGNASSGEPPGGGDAGRYFQFIAAEARVRQLTRVVIKRPFDLMIATTIRYVDPRSYGASRLEQDAANIQPDGSPLARGLRPLGHAALGTGFIYDTRDNEFFPRSGGLHQVGIKFSEGFPLDADVRYGQASAVFVGYVPVGGPFVFASRLAADFQFGNVPFYDLFTGGPFITIEMPGGSSGVRGVPVGRYSGLIKAVGNVELRGMFFGFKLLAQTFHFGADAFFDTGRVWEDYSFRSKRDGDGIGLKWGTGVGAYLQWGQAAVFRVEAAYSPDAASENPNFPIGLYVADGVMF